MTGQHGQLTGPRGLAARLLIVTGAGAAMAGCGTGHALSAAPPAASPAPSAAAGAPQPASPPADPGSAGTALAGRTIGIDPGHNGGNVTDPAFINGIIWNGRENETCDTTGTQTDGGYTEATFNWNVARYLRADLRRAGARVVMTRHSNNGVGPCVTGRAHILNRAGATVALDIHADGGPAWGRGFTVLEPVADGPNDGIITASERLGNAVRAALLKYTGMPVSNYYGHDGLISRDDLAGLNLATEPKVLVECGNMRNPTDARLLTASWFQRRLARALQAALVTFLGAGP
ncbi:MAG TPA: N-acetylmuramoyl-L-alanine amidase [Streptosporangiaceae bacterium]